MKKEKKGFYILFIFLGFESEGNYKIMVFNRLKFVFWNIWWYGEVCFKLKKEKRVKNMYYEWNIVVFYSDNYLSFLDFNWLNLLKLYVFL